MLPKQPELNYKKEGYVLLKSSQFPENFPSVPWSVSVQSDTIATLGKISMHQLYLDPQASLSGFLRAREKIKKLYGLPLVIHIPGLCYVHISTLGSEIVFPENSEPNVKKPIIKDLNQINNFPSPNFLNSGLVPHFIRMYEFFKKKLPDEKIGFGLGVEGPITTAVLLRGTDFFVDVKLCPQNVHKLLAKVIESIKNFEKVVANFHGVPYKQEEVWLVDDFAGLFSPEDYEKFAIPCTKKYYDLRGAKARHLHCELLRREHLKYLIQMGITLYDPDADQYLSPRIIKEEIDIPFYWRPRVNDMMHWQPEEVKSACRKAVQEGASFIDLELYSTIPEKNVRAFIEVGEELKGGNNK